MGLKVIDLYCGAGGFSEGFRQVGFEIKAGFDNWKDARTTFQKNFPEALVPENHVDIPESESRIVDLVQNKIGHVDVIIGGPPCVEFSSSKNAGKGNIDEGLRHVKAFFDIVKELEPKYWVMENVPRIESFLERSIDERRLNPPPRRRVWIFNSQFHHVPQARRRLFTGNFPGEKVKELEDHHKSRNMTSPMRNVVLGLPDCFEGNRNGSVQDPVYPRLKVDKTLLTDHLGYGQILRLTSWERMKNLDLKRNHPFCGRMVFPENLDRPARTIMATQFSVSRESMVIEDPNRRNVLRMPTPRESACMQGFPLTYQFWGNSIGSRYKLAGNAVPIGLSRDIAKSILLDRGEKAPRAPKLRRKVLELSPEIKLQPRRSHVLQGPFHWHPTGSLVNGCRVDLDNTDRYEEAPDPSPITKNLFHVVRWHAVLHVGIGRPRWRHAMVEQEAVLEALRVADMGKQKERMLLSSVRALHGEIPDASTLHHSHRHPSRKNWRKSPEGVMRPRALLDMVDSVRGYVTRSKNSLVECRDLIDVAPEKGLPLITLVSAFILYWMCKEINDCNHWLINNADKRFMPNEWEGRGNPTKESCKGVMSREYPRSI